MTNTATSLLRQRMIEDMTVRGFAATSMNAAVSALRFFFGVTLGRSDANADMTTVREPAKLPVVLSSDEVARLLEAAPGLKYTHIASTTLQAVKSPLEHLKLPST